MVGGGEVGRMSDPFLFRMFKKAPKIPLILRQDTNSGLASSMYLKGVVTQGLCRLYMQKNIQV